MRVRWLAVLALALLCPGGPAASAEVKVLDLISDSGGPGAIDPTITPATETFLASPDVSEGAASGLTLTLHSLLGDMYWWYWGFATVVGREGDDIRSVDYRFRHQGKDVRATATDAASQFGLAMKLSSAPPPTIEAHVTVARSGKAAEVVVLRAQVPSPGLKAANDARDSQPQPTPRGTASPPSPGTLPAGVRFSVRARPETLEGGVETGYDVFKFLLEGDAKGLSQIRRVEYSVSTVEAGDPRRDFFLEGSVLRDRWPIAVKITWRSGKVTQASLERP